MIAARAIGCLPECNRARSSGNSLGLVSRRCEPEPLVAGESGNGPGSWGRHCERLGVDHRVGDLWISRHQASPDVRRVVLPSVAHVRRHPHVQIQKHVIGGPARWISQPMARARSRRPVQVARIHDAIALDAGRGPAPPDTGDVRKPATDQRHRSGPEIGRPGRISPTSAAVAIPATTRHRRASASRRPAAPRCRAVPPRAAHATTARFRLWPASRQSSPRDLITLRSRPSGG